MPTRREPTDLETARHDLKNVLTALRSGCTLIDAELGSGGHAAVRDLLAEMRATIDGGAAVVERLRIEERVTSAGSSMGTSGSALGELKKP